MRKQTRNSTVSAVPEPKTEIHSVIPQDSAPASDEAAKTASDDTIERLTLPVDKTSGKIAWNRLRSPEKTEKSLKTIFDDPRFQTQGSDAAAAPDAALNGLIVNVLYDAISMIAMVTARSAGYGADSAELLRFTMDEKTQLAAPTIKVLDKYNLLGGKYADEIMLLVAVGGVTGAHYIAMQQHHAAKQARPPAVEQIGVPA